MKGPFKPIRSRALATRPAPQPPKTNTRPALPKSAGWWLALACKETQP